MPRIAEILASDLTAKKKSKAMAEELARGTLRPSAFSKVIPTVEGAELATVVEALEGATRKSPNLVDAKLYGVLIGCLTNEASRVRWEAARTIGNVAEQHPKHAEKAATALMKNTCDESSVVRWATAHALSAILRGGYSARNLPARLRDLASREKDDGVRGIYEKALRRLG